LVIPGALSILTHVFPDPVERGHAIGAWSSFSAVTLIIGPMLGGLLVDNVGWPSIFLINLPVGMVALALGLVGITESADPDHAALDPAGQLLSVIFLAALTYSLIGNADAEWSAEVALIVAAFALALFVIVEIRAVRPLLPLDLFREPAFAAANFASFVLGFAGYSSLFLFALFLQQAQGWTATQAGWGVTPVFAAMAMVAAMFGVLAGATTRVGSWFSAICSSASPCWRCPRLLR
jgi:MFS family permease